jgi:uracil-DNA glycosylase family 4
MGFFYSESSTKTDKTKTKKIPVNSARDLQCKVCPREKFKIFSPKMDPIGSENPDIYILIDQPSKDDDAHGEPLYGKAGHLIFEHLSDNWQEYVRINYVVRCHGSSSINDIEFICCEKFLQEDIEKTKPKLIIGLGSVVLSHLFKDSGIAVWRNRFIPVKIGSHTSWFFPTFSPEFILSKRREDKHTKQKTVKTEYDHSFKLDILRALKEYKNLPKAQIYETDLDKGIEFTTGNRSDKELKKVITWLKEASTWGPHALDIETNGLRPYTENPLILSIAIGTFDKTYSFPIHYPGCWTKEQQSVLMVAIKEYLLNSDTKFCHNAQFEQEWLSYSRFFGSEVLRNTSWGCTQAQAYTMDERRGMLSLDILCKINFGINLKAMSNLDRANLIKAPIDQVLKYNALDTKWTDLLAQVQTKKLKKERKLLKVYNQLIKSIPTLAKAQQVGLVINYDLRDSLDKEVTQEINEVTEEIRKFPEVLAYERRNGRLNLGSPQALLQFFKGGLQLDEELKDKHGKQSTGEEIIRNLDKIKYPFAPKILQLRALSKKYGTYIEPLVSHAYPSDGRVHTNFNLYETRTGRLSSNNPNMQNWPNRRGKELRRLIIAPKDSWIVASDYGQIEARILGVASQDPVYCDAMWNNYDIHLEWAERIAKAYPDVIGGRANLGNEEKIKKFRKDVKNQWTFPAFYGSSPYSIARAIKIPTDTVLHLFQQFWKMFAGVKKWQKRVANFYDQNGYVETLTGRRRYGPLTFNEGINSPIQGTASDICVNAMNHLSEAGINVIMNIHDDVTSYVKDEELEQTIDVIAEIMCKSAYELIPFLNVPIAIEISAGTNWCDQEEVGTYFSTEFMKVDKKLHNPEEFMAL